MWGTDMQSDSRLNEFRADLRAILRRELPEDIRLTVAKRGTNIPPEMIRRWQKILFNLGGWSCPNWTKEDGGPGWSLEQQYIFHYELALAQAPPTRVFN